jgi:hypothetical protein
MLEGIIDSLDQREDGKAMVNILGGAIFDYDVQLLKRLYRKINASPSLVVSRVLMNHFVWGALHFNDRSF